VSTKKTEGIPLATLIKGDGFKRNYDIEFKTALDAELIAAAMRGDQGVKRRGKLGDAALYIQKIVNEESAGTKPRKLRELMKGETLIAHMTEDALESAIRRAQKKRR